ncbi:MAG TPA: rRNA maturation RNase YbeY [Candidatus Paceibacterota bacterium]|nr:rRNA maturation RNase YbeY [Candidatus Paceibacterota bacterium]
MATTSLRNLTRRSAPRFPYEAIANHVLPKWEVSLVYVTKAKAKAVNSTLRNKTYVPNVLSYVTGTKSGEILICLEEAKKQAPEYGMSYTTFVAFLFIHGCLHLNGKLHGPTMERTERALLARFISVPSKRNGPTKNRNRHRHRHPSDENRRR